MMKEYYPCIRLFVLAVLAQVILVSTSSAAVIYVAPGAGGANDGTSWSDAYTNLQTAITNSVSSDEIWVKAGTYIPASAPNYANPQFNPVYYHFHLKNGVTLYGGFAGDETTLDERDISGNPTILSGNNVSYNVIWHDWNWDNIKVNSTAVLDGFILTMSTSSAVKLENEAATIRNCTFTNNSGSIGAAINNRPSGSHTYVSNSTFIGNSSTVFGGAIYGNGYSPKSVYITNCTFVNNSSAQGGALYSLYNGIKVTNSTFTGNTASSNGRAFYNKSGAGNFIKNSILWDGGSEIYNEGVTDSVTVTYSVVQDGGLTEDGNTGDDPLFDDLGLQDNGGPVQTIAITQAGSAYDTGTDVGAPATDARWIPRPQSMGYDMGAYEIIVKSEFPWTMFLPATTGISQP